MVNEEQDAVASTYLNAQLISIMIGCACSAQPCSLAPANDRWSCKRTTCQVFWTRWHNSSKLRKEGRCPTSSCPSTSTYSTVLRNNTHLCCSTIDFFWFTALSEYNGNVRISFCRVVQIRSQNMTRTWDSLQCLLQSIVWNTPKYCRQLVSYVSKQRAPNNSCWFTHHPNFN